MSMVSSEISTNHRTKQQKDAPLSNGDVYLFGAIGTTVGNLLQLISAEPI
jgi:hypothetical protein